MQYTKKMDGSERKGKSIAIIAAYGDSLIRFRGNLISGWIARGYNVTCVSIEPAEEMKESVERLGAKYYQVSGSRTDLGVVSELKMIRKYIDFYRSQKPDYAYLYMSKPLAYGGPAAVLAKVPHINVLVNGLENAYYRKGIKNAAVRCIMSSAYWFMGRWAENVFFQNRDDYAYFLKHRFIPKNNAYIVDGSGVDMGYFSKKELPEAPVFLMVARLLWSKGIREYIEATAKLRKECPTARVLLVGGLDENDEALKREELETAIRESEIEYCGYSKDVRPFLEECSVFVLPSYHEGTPRSVLEAMATGRPVITTEAPGCRETVEDGVNGFLVPVRDSDTLAEKMILLAKDNNLRRLMAEKSYCMCKEKYDVNGVNDQINKLMFKEN